MFFKIYLGSGKAHTHAKSRRIGRIRSNTFVRVGSINSEFMFPKEKGQCFARTPMESESYRSTWIFPDHGNIDYFEPSKLFSTLKKFGINKILFAGDSLTAQIFEHFTSQIYSITKYNLHSKQAS